MEILRIVAQAGKTIVLVVHQPRVEIFRQIDNIILLDNGNSLYVGARDQIISYFENLGYIKDLETNPADFMLDIVSSQSDDKVNLASLWNAKQQTNCNNCNNCNTTNNHHYMHMQPLTHAKCQTTCFLPRKRPNFFDQCWLCFKRGFILHYRDRMGLITDITMSSSFGLLVGFLTNVGTLLRLSKIPRWGLMVILPLSLSNVLICLRTFGNDRSTFRRYITHAGINKYSYYFGLCLSTIPWQIILQPLLYVSMLYVTCLPLADIRQYYFLAILSAINTQGIAHFGSLVLEPTKAQLISPLIALFFLLLSGVIVSLNHMNKSVFSSLIASASYARWLNEAWWIIETKKWSQVFDKSKILAGDSRGWNINDYSRDVIMLIILALSTRIITILLLPHPKQFNLCRKFRYCKKHHQQQQYLQSRKLAIAIAKEEPQTPQQVHEGPSSLSITTEQ